MNTAPLNRGGFSMVITRWTTRTLAFVRGLISEPSGEPSSTRVLMFLFSFFTMWVVQRIIYHVTHLTDVAMVSVYLSNLPIVLTALIGLIAAPYAINKGTASFSDIASMITAAKQKDPTTSLTELKAELTDPTTPPATATTSAAVGTPGQKG